MPVYFASDVHLGGGDPAAARAVERKFLAWLDLAGKDAEAILLVGDIFDFWFEYRRVIPTGYARVLGKLAELTDRGVRVVLFTGNHDMWTGDCLARECGVEAYIADPVVVDERMEIAKLCGIREIRRRSIFHALNQKATARIHAESLGRRYEDMNFVIAHMGGGISVAAHLKGRAIDCNNALDGEGPVAPERAGTIPAGALIDLCYSGRYTHEQARALIVGGGGLVSLAGTNSVKELELRESEGDEEARAALDLLCYTVAKEIGAMAAALSGEVDAIILTGGIAYSRRVTDAIASRCRFVAPVTVYAGENELQALALNALRVLRGETQPKIYV